MSASDSGEGSSLLADELEDLDLSTEYVPGKCPLLTQSYGPENCDTASGINANEDGGGQLSGLSIWKVPPARILKDAMKCQICGNVGAPPNYQCEKGHLICGKHFNLDESDISLIRTPATTAERRAFKKSPSPLRKTRVIQKCLVSIINEETNETSNCGADVFQGGLELYSHLYNASIMNCPAAHVGCIEKLPGSNLLHHLRNSCFYNLITRCPASYCRTEVPRAKMVEHLNTNHQVQIFEGSTCRVKVFQVSLNQNELVKFKHYCWVGAILKYGGHNFILMLRDDTKNISLWLHQLQSEPKRESVSFEDEVDDEAPQPQESSVREIPLEKLQYQLTFKNETRNLEASWIGTIASSEIPVLDAPNSGICFQMGIGCLKKRYMMVDENQEIPSWIVYIKLEEIQD